MEFPESNALLLLVLQHVVKTMIDTINTRKKWLNKASMTQKPHRKHVEPIEKSNDQPVLKLLHNVAHAGLEFPQHPQTIKANLPRASFKIKTGRNPTF